MDDQQLYERIEAYLQRQLSPEEAAAFEAAIEADPSLAEEVASHRLHLLAGERLAEKNLQKKFDQWRIEADLEESSPLTPSSPFLSIRLWPIVVLVLMVLSAIFGIWKWRQHPPSATVPSPPVRPIPTDTSLLPKEPIAAVPSTPDIRSADQAQRLLAFAGSNLDQYMDKFAGQVIRGKNTPESPEDRLLEQADSLLKIKKYSNAVDLLETLRTVPYFESSALKRLAFAHYKLGQYHLAINDYEQYAALTPANEEEHDWILSLYLLADYPRSMQRVHEQLEKIHKNPQHAYYRQAEMLKQALR